MRIQKKSVHNTETSHHQPPNHRAGGLIAFGRCTVVIDSTGTSTAVVRGDEGVPVGLPESGDGCAALRVPAGAGTVTVDGGDVSVTVWRRISGVPAT